MTEDNYKCKSISKICTGNQQNYLKKASFSENPPSLQQAIFKNLVQNLLLDSYVNLQL